MPLHIIISINIIEGGKHEKQDTKNISHFIFERDLSGCPKLVGEGIVGRQPLHCIKRTVIAMPPYNKEVAWLCFQGPLVAWMRREAEGKRALSAPEVASSGPLFHAVGTAWGPL